MAATGLQVNWKNVSFEGTVIDRVTNVSIATNPQNIKFKGDDARYAQVIVNVNNEPSISVTSGNVGVIMGLPLNGAGTVQATHKDARGQAGGDVVYSMDCIITDLSSSGAHAAFGTASALFEGVSADGITSPIAFTRA